jgi:hypothetical protein
MRDSCSRPTQLGVNPGIKMDADDGVVSIARV